MPITDIKDSGGMPFIRYSIQEMRWYLSTEDKDMKEVKMTSPVIIDIENVQQGWLQISSNGRDWVSWGKDNKPTEKPSMEHKPGFMMNMYSTKMFEDAPVRQLSSNAVALNMFMKNLYNACEKTGNFGSGKVPAVLLLDAKRIKIGKGNSVELLFDIKSWVDRPEELDNNVDIVESNDHQNSSRSSSDDTFEEAI
tara:strand:+ start:368 stop:952 length:585 start_codon:yes stop_codon:yes gene_type:complete